MPLVMLVTAPTAALPLQGTTSFFLVTAAAPTPVSGESPTTRIDLIKVRIAR
jgi:hypothetical protein